MKLLDISPSTKPDKKFVATFLSDNGRKKSTHFGAKGMDDYTITHDKAQRERYRTRHAKDLATKDPSKAGFLSYYLLWGSSTSMATNTTDFKRKFGL